MPTQINEISKVFLHGETLESAELNEIISLVNLTIRKINNVETNLENHSYDVSIPITNIYCRTKKGINAINFFPQADAKRDELLDLVSNCSTTQGIKYNTTFSTVTLSDNADLMNGIWTAYPQGVSESLPHEWEVSYKRLEDNSIMYMFGPVLRSNYGYSGADGDSVQYVYKTFSHLLTDIERTNNTPIRPENPHYNGEFIPSGWFDDPQGPTAEYPFEYVATLKRINGTWGSFEKIALWSTYTEDGANGDFLIRAFCRFTPTSNKLAPNTPIGGVYNSPLPGSNDNIQWSLNVPSGTEPVWTSTKIFRGSGQDTEWSTPTIEADSTTLDIEYSSNTEKPAENTLRDTPGNNHPSTGIWHDPTEVNIDLSTMIWRAERKIKNGQYDGNWVITKIAGTKGAFKSIVFRRFKPTQQLSSPATPTGGTYSNPIPDGGLWYDGIPAGDSKTDGPIWSSTKIFHDDGTLTNWSAPQLQSDSEDLDIEFSPGIGEEHTQPSNPIGEPFSNREASGWYDPSSANFNTAGDMIWRAERKVKNGLYVGAWTVTKIVGEQGPEGKKGSFKSCVFKRSNNTLTGFNASDDGGATYDNPIPIGWTDGIPAGTETLWMAVSLFTGEGDNHSNWTVTQLTDNIDLDIEFSPGVGNEHTCPSMDLSAGSVFTHPINNYESNGITLTADRTARNNLGWWDSSLITNQSPTMIWRAERKIHNQNYEGNWVITRINGENGEDGKNAVLVSLDNEHEDFLYNDVGTLIAPSGGTTSQARLYDGNIDKTLNTTWRISDDGGINWGTTTNTNANASINTSTGLLTITGINANSVKIKVRGEYNGKYYYIEFTANKTNLDKYDLLINPNAIAYNPATYQAQNITINVKRTDLQGNATNLNWGAYNNRNKISTTADKGYLRAFIFLYQLVAQDTYDVVPVRQLSSTFLATAASMEHLDNFRIELRKYSDPNSSDANDFTIVDYENIEIAKVTNGIDGINGNDAVNVVCTPASLIVNLSLLNPDNLDNITTNNTFNVKIYKGTTEITPTSITFAVEQVNNNYTSEFTVNGSATPASTGTISGGVLTLKKILKNGSNYYETSTVNCTATYSDGIANKTIAFTLRIYANLLGTWGESVKGSVKLEIATSKLFSLDNGHIVESDYLGNFIRSSKENTSRLEEETFFKITPWSGQSITLSASDIANYGTSYRLTFDMDTTEEDVKVYFAGITKEVKSYNTFKKTYTISEAGTYAISFAKASNDAAISPTISNLALYAVTSSKYSQLKQTSDGLVSTVKASGGNKNLFNFSNCTFGIATSDCGHPAIQSYGMLLKFAGNSDVNGRLARVTIPGLITGKNYTFSCQAKMTNASARIEFDLGDSSGGTQTVQIGTTWLNIEVTMLFNRTGLEWLDIGIVGTDYASGNYALLRHIKVEEGEIATAFNIAEEDINNVTNVRPVDEWTMNSLTEDTTITGPTGKKVYKTSSLPDLPVNNTSTYIDYICKDGLSTIQTGKVYTISYWIKASVSDAFLVGTYLYPDISTESQKFIDNSETGLTESIKTDGATFSEVSTLWTKRYIHFYVETKPSNGIINCLPIRLARNLNSNLNSSGILYISDVQFCEGYVTNTNYTINESYSEIKQTASEINSTVSNIDGRVTLIQLTVNGINVLAGVSESTLNSAGLYLRAGLDSDPSIVKVMAGQFSVVLPPEEEGDPEEIIFGNDPSTNTMVFSGDLKTGGEDGDYYNSYYHYLGIFPNFSTGEYYDKGECVRYNNKVYRFNKVHPSGAWKTGEQIDYEEINSDYLDDLIVNTNGIYTDGSGRLGGGHIYWNSDGSIYLGTGSVTPKGNNYKKEDFERNWYVEDGESTWSAKKDTVFDKLYGGRYASDGLRIINNFTDSEGNVNTTISLQADNTLDLALGRISLTNAASLGGGVSVIPYTNDEHQTSVSISTQTGFVISRKNYNNSNDSHNDQWKEHYGSSGALTISYNSTPSGAASTIVNTSDEESNNGKDLGLKIRIKALDGNAYKGFTGECGSMYFINGICIGPITGFNNADPFTTPNS